MKKLIALSAAALLIAVAVMAQPSPPADPPDAAAPAAPACPQAMGMGQGMGMGHGGGMGQMHGMRGGQGMAGCMGGGMGSGMGMGMRGIGGRDMAGAMLLRNADKLGLTDQQVDQLKTMREAHRLDMVDAHAAVEKAQIRLQSLMRDDSSNEQDVLRAIEEDAQARAEIAKKRYLNRQECMSLLTSDQQAKLKELRQDRMQDRQEMRMNRQNQRPGRGQGQGMGRNFRDQRFKSNG